MADTWTAIGTALNTNTLSTNKAWFYLFNGSAATRVLRVYRVGLLNIQTAAVTGVLATLELRKYTGGTWAGTAVTPLAHDTTNTALEAAVSAGSNIAPGGTPTSSAMKHWIWSTDEATVSTWDLDFAQAVFPLCSFWEAGDEVATPIVLRANEGIAVYCTAASGTLAGLIDIFITFTNEAS